MKITSESLACRYLRRWSWGLTSRGRRGGGKSIHKNASNWALRNQDRSSNMCECHKRHGIKKNRAQQHPFQNPERWYYHFWQIAEHFQQDRLECNDIPNGKSFPIHCCTEMQCSPVFKLILFPLNVLPNLTHISANIARIANAVLVSRPTRFFRSG